MSVLDRLDKIEKCLELVIGKAKINHTMVGMLHNENEALSQIFGDAYVEKLRDIENILMCLLDHFFGDDKKYEQLKKNTPLFERTNNDDC
jgi:hypothetical protein